MAAEEHPDGHAGHDGDADAGYDALMAAITGESLPPDADLGERRAYGSAAADVALLREQLGLLGTALSGPPPVLRAPEAPLARPRRRFLAPALGALAVACAGALVAGLGWLGAQGGSGASEDAAGKGVASDEGAGSAASGAFGSPHYLACARLVAEGTVTAAEPVPGTGRHRITLDVTRAYKTDGPGERDAAPVTFVLDDATARPAPGDQALIGIPRYGDTPDVVITGSRAVAAERAVITASLAESRTLTCD
ncbi:hypothetical protein [Streptomyces sp. SID5789]|uniref:hypothetical protein n=1 Tax=Streptomyces sp. SID5789 TaxID=2690310 RepID=UPI00138101E6|nr:hypothetical protein [Streptomyces sp. SID5789]MZE74214.1 hypothetical protein [Streptomyces sp. SID5789]